ncbi:hypothetical protein FIU82_16225 (plasmid) [Pseudoalteromonas sp. THAF3]|uniref:STAS/SEC14 domain-containing protein n=1 Tax=Pseudoalteromonas sp. THAF3 TaxID=2587843 RepID=UPI00126817E5|nr:STAS/SEC14 domain-containing protein [Pseudoalteromonas sp. THAF3]QFU06536.1 hypothetical protein FIU82_16225 [Pseudoalteromonas sp. THAF3]
MAKGGLKVDIERHQQRIYIALVLTGTLNHEHYQLLTPLFASALADIDEPIVDVFIDASQLDGFTTRAMWDDFKLGVIHRKQFKRIALYGHKRWQSFAASVANWFVSGEVKYFDDPRAAIAWLSEH